MPEETKPALQINSKFLLVASGIILVSAIVSSVLFFQANGMLSQKLAVTTEANRPANLDLTVITDQTCPDCFDVQSLIAQIKKENVKINSTQTVDAASPQGQQLIAQYGIQKLPSFIIKGELKKDATMTKFFAQAGDVSDDTFVFTKPGAPYVDLANSTVRGRLNLVLITDITCTQCYDVTQHENILRQSGLGLPPNSKVIDIKSAEGRALKNKYGIKLVPTFVLSGDLASYPDFQKFWSGANVGITAKDGAYIFTTTSPIMGPYKDLTSNKMVLPPPQVGQTNQQ